MGVQVTSDIREIAIGLARAHGGGSLAKRDDAPRGGSLAIMEWDSENRTTNRRIWYFENGQTAVAFVKQVEKSVHDKFPGARIDCHTESSDSNSAENFPWR